MARQDWPGPAFFGVDRIGAAWIGRNGWEETGRDRIVVDRFGAALKGSAVLEWKVAYRIGVVAKGKAGSDRRLSDRNRVEWHG